MKVEKPRQIYRLSGFQRRRGKGIKRNERCSSQLQSDVSPPPPVMKMALSPLRHSLHSCSVFVSLPLRFDVSFSFDSIRSFLLLVPCTIAKKNVVREISEMNFSEDDSRLIILPTEL